MSSKPIDTCTECMETVRASDIITFHECNKHRFCKGCLGKATTQSSTRSSHEKCPLCELSHRRLAVTVRCDLWAEAHAKVHCKGCGSHASGQRMTCGHGYCTPCLRKLPRSSLSRNLDGSMKSACQDCAKKAAEKFREEARSAMLHAEDIASRERDERESRERIEDLRLAREFRAKPRKRPAPSAPAVPAAPAAAAAAPSGSHAAASTASNLAKATTQSQRKGAGATGLERKVSFNPMVQQKIITPLQRNKRLSMPPAPQAASTSINSHTDSSEPITPVEKLRTFSRYWGVNSP